MSFDSPIWLILLAPWLALVLWLLIGRSQFQAVPFLQLWHRQIPEHRRPKRAWTPPPLALVLLLAAIFCSIFAAARPTVHHRENSAASVVRSRDVKIEYLAARAAPTTQAMIRLRNESDLTSANLTIHAGDSAISQSVNLPGRDQSQNYFVDLPTAPAVIEAEASSGIAQIDHRLQIARSTAWPIIDPQGQLPPAIIRMIDVYTRDRPRSEGSAHIAVINSSQIGDASESAVIFADPQAGSSSQTNERPNVQDSPLTRFINWNDALAGARIESPTGNWQPLVSVGRAVALAVRDQSVKQVWIGFDSDDFPRRPDFVILWTNIFNWLGKADDPYQTASGPPLTPNSSQSTAAEAAIPLGGVLFMISLTWALLSATVCTAPKIPQRNDIKC